MKFECKIMRVDKNQIYGLNVLAITLDNIV